MNVKVIKNDGSKEVYDEKKIKNVVMAAGLDKEQSITLAKGITSWIVSQEVDSVSSQEIRSQVYKKLQKVDKYTANFYRWYKKTENKTTDPNPSKN